MAGGTLYTAQIPIRADGSYETGDFRAQTELTLANLDRTLQAAGLKRVDVVQVLAFLTDVADRAVFNELYAAFFAPPFPNRATIIAAGLAVPGMRIELVIHARAS